VEINEEQGESYDSPNVVKRNPGIGGVDDWAPVKTTQYQINRRETRNLRLN
jgi:hypothetical protein